MTQTLNTLSQSSLQDYADCPRRFELRYIQRLNYPAVQAEPALENEKHQQEGESFHRLAQQYFIGVPAEILARQAAAENLQRWWKNFSASTHIAALKKMNVRAEMSLSAPLGGFRLVAKYDLLASDKDKLLIYDWKTYRKRPADKFMADRWQTRIYRALLLRAGVRLHGGQAAQPEQVEMTYWYADFPGEAARFTYSAAQFQRDWDALTALAEELAAATSFPMTDEIKKCGYCPYRSYCNRGVRAESAQDAELDAAEEPFDLNFEQIAEVEL
ncbi:MAG: PD-(D/E)XK nuclease family protein [Anaerolineales bacterium]